jgi:drug/metabolite transporter (DMT)-like permease
MKKAFIQLHTAIFLAGFTGILGRLIDLNEGFLVFYRLVITVITLWVMYYFQKKIVRIPLREMAKIFAVGFIAVMHWVTFYGSIKYSNISVALVCFSSLGFFSAILEPVIFRKRIRPVELFLGLLTIAGIAIIFHFDPQYKKGIIIGIVSALLGCLFPIFNRQFLRDHSSETVTLYELTGGLLSLAVFLPFYLVLFPAGNYIPSLQDIGWLFVLSWLCTVLAFNLSMASLKKVSAFTVNLSYNIEPVYGITLAFIVYKENKFLSGQFYLGLALIVSSVLLQTFLVYSHGKPQPKSAETNQAALPEI